MMRSPIKIEVKIKTWRRFTFHCNFLYKRLNDSRNSAYIIFIRDKGTRGPLKLSVIKFTNSPTENMTVIKNTKKIYQHTRNTKFELNNFFIIIIIVVVVVVIKSYTLYTLKASKIRNIYTEHNRVQTSKI